MQHALVAHITRPRLGTQLIANDDAESLRRAISDHLGCPPEHIVVSATHTHSGPSTRAVFGQEKNQEYLPVLLAGAREAAARAHESMTECALSFQSGQCDGVAFNRRWLMADGGVQTHPLKNDPLMLSPEGPDSTALHVLAATRSHGDTPIGAAVFFGCHATVMPRESQLISADFPGRVRESLVAKWDAQSAASGPADASGADASGAAEICQPCVLYLQTACGNICQCDPTNGCACEVGIAHCKMMGEAIGTAAHELLEAASMPTSGQLRVATEILQLPRRVLPPELLGWAERHKDDTELPPPTLSDYGTEPAGSDALSLEALFHTPWFSRFYARELLTLRDDGAAEPLLPFYIAVVCQGTDWAVVNLPCELFIEHQEAIVSRSGRFRSVAVWAGRRFPEIF
uniref:Neutral/alkaline non-lysosomal ceramidase N-terminal domain-containing protein n=1 Tax=Prymnesium polylepis TaxID=72548 RepID=A0A7S4HRX1_9EUKA|mmetsp:Transcript_21415/g.52619  ORF Transcript_21415/g.52619 Transcript_21415/m.52619 type:complete len:402 (+) Transcript_21415:166-1371(+)